MTTGPMSMCGTDPCGSGGALFTDYIMPAIQGGQKAIFLLPHSTSGTAFAEKNDGTVIEIQPGTDLPIVLTIARVIVDNGWDDSEWIEKCVNSKRDSSPGFDRDTRNTP